MGWGGVIRGYLSTEFFDFLEGCSGRHREVIYFFRNRDVSMVACLAERASMGRKRSEHSPGLRAAAGEYDPPVLRFRWMCPSRASGS